jgi:VCBS repeat-containing protein
VLTVTVNGANDLAVITPQSSPADVQAALRATDTTTTKSGTVVVKDDDAGQSVFQQPTSDMRKGAYGNFTFEEPEGSSNGKWTYALDGSNTALHALGAGDVVTDLLTLRSNDGTATQNITITITGANDAPVLVQNTTLALATFDQNLAAPTGVMGIKVSGLIAGITDADSGAQKGIAITDVDSTHGTLWATFNGGTDWMAVTGVDAAHALLMRNDDNTQVYYQEKANPDASVHDASALTSAFTFVAWDQTTGKAATQVDANARGAENAFSVDAQQVQVNDTFQLDALTDTFLGGTGFDTLVLNQPLGTLDLTAVKFTGIEKIATTAHGANAIILNAASVGQADAMGGVHQLFIEGDANDGVTFTGHAEAIAADTTRVSGYDRYALDATHALLLQHGMTMVFTA